MLNQYEIVFIMTPVLSEDQISETVDKYKKILKDDGIEKVHLEKWGLRKLAYPIQKKSTGFYFLIEFAGNGKIIPDLEIAFKRYERILRFLTVKMDKHAIAYNKKRKSGSFDKSKAPRNKDVNKEQISDKKTNSEKETKNQIKQEAIIN